MAITVKCGRSRTNLPFPSPDTKLSELRRQLAEQTHLPENAFKLIHAGAVMKDDNAPISAYSLRDNSTIVMLEIGKPEQSHNEPLRKTEQSTIAQVRSEIDFIQSTLLPEVDSFLLKLSPGSQHALTARGLELEHRRLAELLLQALLRLDAIVPDVDWEDARTERKGAVKEVHALLDRLDEEWGKRSTLSHDRL